MRGVNVRGSGRVGQRRVERGTSLRSAHYEGIVCRGFWLGAGCYPWWEGPPLSTCNQGEKGPHRQIQRREYGEDEICVRRTLGGNRESGRAQETATITVGITWEESGEGKRARREGGEVKGKGLDAGT